VWGLIRSAQEENPGRFLLVDTDGAAGSLAMLPAVVNSGQREAAIRDGEVRVPRLTRVAAAEAGESRPWRDDGSVLITGGTDGLGALFARHLVTERGVRHLILASRRGLTTPGAADLAAELTTLGADVTVAACDVTDRDAVRGLLAQVPAAHPLTAVLHAAAVSDNGLAAGLTREQLGAVLAPKVDGAWHLHELTADLELAAFVLFSSCVGLVIGAGQANYAAANRFADALAAHRRRAGLPAVSLAFGPWAIATGLGGASRDDVHRLVQRGLPLLSPEEGIALFEEALGRTEPVLVPARIDEATLASAAGSLPPLLQDLARAPAVPASTPAAATGPAESPAAGPADGGATLTGQLAALDGTGRLRLLQDVVRAHIAAVRHGDAGTIAMSRDFTELGLDSLAGIDLRNRLQEATGLRLPATLIFDYPTPADLAEFVLEELEPDLPPPAGQQTAEPEPDEDSIRRAIGSIPLATLRTEGLLATLLRLAGPADDGQAAAGPAAPQADESEAIKGMSAAELVRKALATADSN